MRISSKLAKNQKFRFCRIFLKKSLTITDIISIKPHFVNFFQKPIDFFVFLCYYIHIIINKNKNKKLKNDYRKEIFCLKLFELTNLKNLTQ